MIQRLVRRRPLFDKEVRRYFPKQPAPLLNYIIHCSLERRFFYVEVAKVGCTSVKRMLQLAVLDGDSERLPEKVHDRDASPIPRPATLSRSLAEVIADPEIFTFTFVRNPYTRTLSAYLDKMVTNQYEKNRLAPKLGLDPSAPISLYEYLTALTHGERLLADIHWTPQEYLVSPDYIAYDFIGRFESFASGLAAVAARIDPGLLDYLGDLGGQAHRTSASSRIEELIGPRERRVIEHLYEGDFRAFGYGRDPRFAAV